MRGGGFIERSSDEMTESIMNRIRIRQPRCFKVAGGLIAAAALWLLISCATAHAAAIFIRIKVAEPAAGTFKLNINGHRHAGEPWGFPDIPLDCTAGQWTPWVDLSKWPWHGKVDRAGGIAEWPSIKVSARPIKPAEAVT